MGVSVRMSRNTRVYLPFWLAIPAYLIAGAIWLAIVVVWLLVLLPIRLVQRRRRA